MGKRRDISDKYRMEVTAKEDCPNCFGTGIRIEQKANATWNRIEISLSVCMCVRVLPRLVADMHTRQDVFDTAEGKSNV
jgi:hypothetical protein